jgi:type II secretory ATPase GspE/PulE/Tfp pilus assembly ATPase PilB-like protein
MTENMSVALAWPIPEQLELIEKRTEDADAARCMVEIGRRQRFSGNLIRLDLVDAFIEVQPDRSRANIDLDLSSFRSVRLVTPVRLRTAGVDAGGDTAPSRQQCLLRLHDGELLELDTVGVIEHPAGLFLYVVSYGNQAIRMFFPSQALHSYRIGDGLTRNSVKDEMTLLEPTAVALPASPPLHVVPRESVAQPARIVTPGELAKALATQRSMPPVRLGDALLQEGHISEAQLQQALHLQASGGKQHLGRILVEMGAVQQEVIDRILAQKLGIPFVSLAKFRFDPAVIKAVPGPLARKLMVVPLYQTDSRMAVAMENPLDNDALQEIAFLTRLKIDPVMAAAEDLREVIGQFYGREGERENFAELMSELDAGDYADQTDGPEQVISESDNTLVRLVNKLILDAYRSGASDIHIETAQGKKPTRVRFRKDGLLELHSEIPSVFRNALVSRLKIMSRLDISERRQPQDGKINFAEFSTVPIELRVATIPTVNGLEDIVLRILTQPKVMPPDELGLSPRQLAQLKALMHKPYGLLLVCGPTGSGKTTTLHSLLSHINTPERKIWTVEDPVEITQDGLRQVQVQAKTGWNFANVLRSFLRADPDVIMVGETRDAETAKTVIEASLTGHLVLSTLHTNGAVESVVRLLDLGMDPFNFGDALLGVVGQRLVRRLCRSCRTWTPASPEALALLASEYVAGTGLDASAVQQEWMRRADNGQVRLPRSAGCDECNHTGYKGRLGIYELLVNSAAVKRQICMKEGVDTLLRTALGEGMTTLRQDGIEKILRGETDWAQVRML